MKSFIPLSLLLMCVGLTSCQFSKPNHSTKSPSKLKVVTAAKNLSGRSGAVFGRSDSCSASKLISVVDGNTDCTQFSNSQAAWSIMINGQCKDISDTTAQIACASASGGGAVFGRSDSCSSSKLETVVGLKTDCSKLSNSKAAWSILIQGVCKDITDTSVAIACSQAKGGRSGGAVFGRSDSCSSGKLISVVDRSTDCNQFSNSTASWSIQVAGQCKDIKDTTSRIACSQAKGAAAIFGRSDSCSSSKLITVVDRNTSCSQLNNQVAWSIMVDGKCTDIPDTTAPIACAQALGQSPGGGGGGGAIYGRSDSCSSSKLISTVDRKTDCNQLGNQAAWSVMIKGKCVDITDTTAKIACAMTKGRKSGAVFGRSDNCSSSKLISVVDRRTDCNQLGNQAAWSIIFKGKCVDITDTTAKIACAGAKGAGAVFGRSDSCSSQKLIAVVDHKTDCNQLGSQAAWSILRNGQCVDISDTTANIACAQAK